VPEIEVTSYKYEYAAVPSSTADTQQRAWLKCYNKEGRVILSAAFSDTGRGENKFDEKRGYFLAYFRLTDLPPLVDMLRNESPIYFKGSEDPETGLVYCRLLTHKEPVGEGETPIKIVTEEVNPWV
jgi:hypothetical protein